MGIGGAGGEFHEIRVVSTYTDQLTGPLARSRSEVDAYTASLERLAAAQARAGIGGGLTAGGATVALSGPQRGSAAVSSSGIGVGAGGPGRTPQPTPPGAVMVGGFAAPGGGGAGRTPGIVPGLAPPGGGRPTSGGAGSGTQTTRLRYVVEGLRDVEAVSGAVGGILQSVLSLRTIMAGGGVAAALVGIPMGLANEATRAQRAFSAMVGSAQQGATLAGQINNTIANQPFDLGVVRGGAVGLSRVSGGKFAGPETDRIMTAITNTAMARGMGDQDVQTITGIMAASRSMQTRRRMTGEMMTQLEDMGIPGVFEAVASARRQAHPGEAWTGVSLRQYLQGGGSLPGIETSREITAYLERLDTQAAAAARQQPDVQADMTRNRVTDVMTQWGTRAQQALAPALGAAAQGDVGGAIGGLMPWNLAQGNLGAGLAIGAVEGVVGANMLDVLIRAPFRAMRPVTRLGRAVGVLPRGRVSGAVPRAATGAAGAAAQAGVPAAAARQYSRTVAQLTRRGADLQTAQSVARASVEAGFGAETAALVEASGVPLEAARAAAAARTVSLHQRAATLAPAAREAMVSTALERQFGPETLAQLRGGGLGRPPNLPPAVGGGAVGIEEAAARDVGILGRGAGALGRVGRGLGRAAPWIGLSAGLLGAAAAYGAGRQEDASRQAGAAVGGGLGGWGGAVAGAAIGSAILPGIGTLAGGLIGGLGGGLGGGWLGEQMGGAIGGAAGLRDRQTANEEAMQQTRQGTDADRQLYDETGRLTSAFTDLERVVRSLTADYMIQRRAGSGGGGSGSFPPSGLPSLPSLTPGAGGLLTPGAVPQPGDIAGWRAWLHGNVPLEQQQANPSLINDMLAGGLAESGLNPRAVQKGGGGRGLFQTDAFGGKGVGATDAQLYDPNWQLKTMLPSYVSAEQRAPGGMSPSERASWVAAHAEFPAGFDDPSSTARRNYAAAYGQVAAAGYDPTPASAGGAVPVSPDINAGGGGGGGVQMGDVIVTVPVTLGGVPADRAGQRQWARSVTDYIAEELATSLSASDAGTSVSTTAIPQPFGG